MRRLSDEAFTAGLAAQKHLLRGLFTADARHRQRHARAPQRLARPARRTSSSSCSASASSRISNPQSHSIPTISAKAEPSPAEACPVGGWISHADPAGARGRLRSLRRAATQIADATACASTRAASALLANTSACCRARSSSSSPTPIAIAIAATAQPRRPRNCDRVAVAHPARQAAGLRPHRAGHQLASSPTASPCTTARSTCSSTTRPATSRR